MFNGNTNPWVITDREKSAAAAERAADKLAKTIFMADYLGEVFEVKILSFQWNGIFVEIADPYVEGFVPLQSIWEDTFSYDERIDGIVGVKTRKKVTTGARFKAILTRLDLGFRNPELEWLCWNGADN